MAKAAFLRQLLDALEEQKQAVAATIVKINGDYPGVAAGNSLLWTGEVQHGSLGSKELDEKVAGLAPEVLAKHRPVLETLEAGNTAVTVFLEPVVPRPEILILGGGHVGQQVAAVGKIAGYRVTVVDDRPDFANRALFPTADKIICNSFTEALKQIKIGPMTFITIVTRGHRSDYECLRAVIGSPAAYIGMIGSRRRAKGVLELLEAEGVATELLQRVHSPIGLDIGGETPAEIAISILAQIIQVYRRGK
ncbi:MAG: XdhC/CoxF family protein [Clostridia bacterium]|nr:XdhC/CoxF family protein [Clostridia bacterium]